MTTLEIIIALFSKLWIFWLVVILMIVFTAAEAYGNRRNERRRRRERMRLYTINELRGFALERALEETREADFPEEEVSRATLIDYNNMCHCLYTIDGTFVKYGR